LCALDQAKKQGSTVFAHFFMRHNKGKERTSKGMAKKKSKQSESKQKMENKQHGSLLFIDLRACAVSPRAAVSSQN